MSPRIIPAYPSGAGGGIGVDFQQAGFWAPPLGPYCYYGNLAVNPSRVLGTRTVCPRAMTITKMGFVVNVAASVDDPVDVGIYDGAGNRLASSGSVSGRLNALGAKIIPLTAPVTLSAGQVIYACMAFGTVGGTAAQFYAMNTSVVMPQLFGTAIPQLEGMQLGGNFPLPAVFSGSPASYTAGPVMAVMQ